MKIRNGFVSNSSTSCFIVYGVKVEEDFDKNSIDETLLTVEEMSEFEDGIITVVGKSLGYFEYSEVTNFNPDELIKAREELKKLFPNESPKLYSRVSAG